MTNKVYTKPPLKFKNIGRFANELSSRFEARINNDLCVVVVKHSATQKWNATFVTTNNNKFLFDDYHFECKSMPEIVELLNETRRNNTALIEKISITALNLDKRIERERKKNLAK